MTPAHWLFVVDLAVILVAVSALGAVTWQRRRSPEALSGLAFAVIAVVSTVNLTMVGHQLRVHLEHADAEFERQQQADVELRRQLSCDSTIIKALRLRDEALVGFISGTAEATSATAGQPILDLPPIPEC